MRYRIFTQTPDGHFDPPRLAHNARLWFRSKLEVLDHEPRRLRLRLHGAFATTPVELTLVAREVTKEDMRDVKAAELAGQAAGMGALAMRCPLLWELVAPDDAPPAAVFVMCAAAASVALGPVLPPDRSTLFGIRGAIERAERAATASP